MNLDPTILLQQDPLDTAGLHLAHEPRLPVLTQHPVRKFHHDVVGVHAGLLGKA